MSNDAPEKPTAMPKLVDFVMANERYKRQRAEYPDFYSYIEAVNSPGIHVELPLSLLSEATRAQVGRFTARRDQPHFAGDEYHGQCDVGGGCEVGWNVSGLRRHPSKFPARVPHDARAAVAKVLGVSPDILEAYWIDDNNKKVLLLEARMAK